MIFLKIITASLLILSTDAEIFANYETELGYLNVLRNVNIKDSQEVNVTWDGELAKQSDVHSKLCKNERIVSKDNPKYEHVIISTLLWEKPAFFKAMLQWALWFTLGELQCEGTKYGNPKQFSVDNNYDVGCAYTSCKEHDSQIIHVCSWGKKKTEKE